MPQLVRLSDSEITSFLPVVLTGWIPSLSTPSALRSLSLPFQLRALHDPLRDYSPPILPLCIQYIQPTCRVCTLHDPRRLWKVRDSNPRSRPSFICQLPIYWLYLPYCARCISSGSLSCYFRGDYIATPPAHLSSFMSSYTPFAIFIAIWCCG